MDFFATTTILEQLAASIPSLPSIPVESSSHPDSNNDEADELPVPVDEERYGVGVTNSWCTVS
ncbi:B mating type pheromone [Pleurotus ostreatus PC15]|uniref:B mating type pheromone n=1 Tax=Pleurotus ostreatus (strain PC15) TaxID=1137138 RepID=A0A067NIN0_PLEO1|nr:B mating type pheromone [Pleurotus ostreatus PC15]